MIKKLMFSLLLLTLANTSNAVLITGEIDTIEESSGIPFSWGDGVNDLFQEWSVAAANSSGWFYASDYFPSSNSDIFVYTGLSDVSTIDDASQFDYQTTGSAFAEEGDTVFFRGNNGFYGAWYIRDIFSGDSVNSNFYSALSGTWYFQTDGSSNFSSVAVPTPGTFLIFLVALAAIFRKNIFR